MPRWQTKTEELSAAPRTATSKTSFSTPTFLFFRSLFPEYSYRPEFYRIEEQAGYQRHKLTYFPGLLRDGGEDSRNPDHSLCEELSHALRPVSSPWRLRQVSLVSSLDRGI